MAEEAESCLRLKKGLKTVINCRTIPFYQIPWSYVLSGQCPGGLEVVGWGINLWVLPHALVSQPAQQCLGSCFLLLFSPPLVLEVL